MTQDGSNLALLSTIIVIINTIIIIIIQNFTRASQNTTRAIIYRKQLVDIWSEPENHQANIDNNECNDAPYTYHAAIIVMMKLIKQGCLMNHNI